VVFWVLIKVANPYRGMRCIRNKFVCDSCSAILTLTCSAWQKDKISPCACSDPCVQISWIHLKVAKDAKLQESLDPVTFGEYCLSFTFICFSTQHQWILRIYSLSCCLSCHTNTHTVRKGVFNVLQNSLAYQIQPEKAKAMCLCVYRCCLSHHTLHSQSSYRGFQRFAKFLGLPNPTREG
jgi:hypothetical protein